VNEDVSNTELCILQLAVYIAKLKEHNSFIHIKHCILMPNFATECHKRTYHHQSS